MAFAQFNQTIEGGRKTSGEYVNGRWVKHPDTAFSIMASVQAANGNELELLPEGRRNAAAWAIRSTDALYLGDVFNIFGTDCEALHIEVWQNGVIPHYLAICAEALQSGPPPNEVLWGDQS